MLLSVESERKKIAEESAREREERRNVRLADEVVARPYQAARVEEW